MHDVLPIVDSLARSLQSPDCDIGTVAVGVERTVKELKAIKDDASLFNKRLKELTTAGRFAFDAAERKPRFRYECLHASVHVFFLFPMCFLFALAIRLNSRRVVDSTFKE